MGEQYAVWSVFNTLWPHDAIMMDAAKPLLETMLTNHQRGLVVFTWRQFQIYARFYTKFLKDLGLTFDKKNGQTRGYLGVGRQGRMYLLRNSPEDHKLLLNTRNNPGLLAIETDMLRDRFKPSKTVVELVSFTYEWTIPQLDPLLVASHGRLVIIHSMASYVTVTMKITGPRTVASKTHLRPVNLLYTIMIRIRKIKPNSGSVRQKPQSFLGDWCHSAWS